MSDWKLKRLIIEIVTGLLIIGAPFAAVAIGVVFWQRSDDHHWYTAAVAAFLGLGAALALWLVAALFSLVVEMADNLQAQRSQPVTPAEASDENLFVGASTAAELARAPREHTSPPGVHSLALRKAIDVPVGAGILLTDAAGDPQIQRVESIDICDGETGHLEVTVSARPPVRLRYDDQVIATPQKLD